MGNEKLRELIAKWRKTAHSLDANPWGYTPKGFESCADELEAALAAEPPEHNLGCEYCDAGWERTPVTMMHRHPNGTAFNYRCRRMAQPATEQPNASQGFEEWWQTAPPFVDLLEAARAAWDAAGKREAAVRRETLEEAAKACEGYEGNEPPEPDKGPDTWDWHASDYARAVRALADLPRQAGKG